MAQLPRRYYPDPSRIRNDPGYLSDGVTAIWRRLHELTDQVAQPPPPDAAPAALPSLSISSVTTPIRNISSPTVVIREGTHGERPEPASVDEGTLYWETDRLHLYHLTFSGTGGKAWGMIEGTGPMTGTLDPDEKPTDLTPSDVGFRYLATDFGREYRWSGTAWVDVPGGPARFGIEWFTAAPEPAAGWQLCDGTVTTRSTAVGGTAAFTAPNLTAANRFLRAVSGATGGTGGAATTHVHPVDPPDTTSGAPSTTTTGAPSATETVDNDGAASTVAVGSDVHTHEHGHEHQVNIAQFNSGTPSGASGDDALPPYYEANPYVRL